MMTRPGDWNAPLKWSAATVLAVNASVVDLAVSQTLKDRFLLEADAVRLRREVRESGVLLPSAESTPENQAIARRVCQAR